MRGEIYFIKGNVRIQITTDKKIYFFMIDKDTCEPTLENVMYNYMSCSQMMFGPKVRSSIVFKQGQSGFSIYQRKMFHNFKVTISDQNFEGAQGCSLQNMNSYVMAQQTTLAIYDNDTF